MKFLKQLSIIITGLVFMFSGIVKAVDPLGSAYKFHDYFIAFNMTWLDWFSLPLGILLCTAEFLAGFSVLTGIRRKEGIIVVILLMIIFTPLTLVLALTNPVSDCGCFGDAIHLTNWQTFWKNVVILIFAAILFTERNNIRAVLRTSSEWAIAAVLVVLFVLFSLGNLRYLPVMDFLPYKTGVKIADQMIIPEDAEPDKYETTFIYEKNGEQKEFTLENYPADDTSWVFVDQKTMLIKKGYQPPIHDFAIVDRNGTDLTSQILADTSFTLFMISRRMEETDPEILEKGFETARNISGKGTGVYVLTATSPGDMGSYPGDMNYCTVDETTLKTIVRANPGYMLIRNGIIKGKWSWATVPDAETFGKILTENTDQTYTGNRSYVIISLVAGVLLILTIFGIRFYDYKKSDA